MGFTVYGHWVSVPMPWLVMYTAIVVYHAPQMKNSRNIIAPRRVPSDFMCGRIGDARSGFACSPSATDQRHAAGSCLMKYGLYAEFLGSMHPSRFRTSTFLKS